ncbi:MAG TPA: hypothetical protein VIY48_12370 [Candidatus Paceibacterota bacterium]
MCGLCGVISPKLTATQIRTFQDLLAVSVLRGDNGAGIVGVPMAANKPIEILRMAGLTSAELAYSADFWQLAKEPLCLLMGHARQPTSGGFEDKDCHPHEAGNIIGMHNGTMTTVMNRVVLKEGNDSAMLFNAINEHGIDQVVKHSNGAFALTYIDKSTETLYFLRNTERPLYWGTIKGENVVYWASEKGFLDLVLPRIYKKEIKTYGQVPLALVSFRIRPLGKVGYTHTRKLSDKPGNVVPLISPPSKHDSDVTMFQTQKGHYHTFEDLRIILASGCAYCKQSAIMTDYTKGIIAWIAPEEFICSECLITDPLARDYAKANGATWKLAEGTIQ